MRRLIALLMLGILLVVTGCTGNSLNPPDRANLENLYVSAVGTVLHWQIGRALADKGKEMGAQFAWINVAVPYTKKEGDLLVQWYARGKMTREIYEIKPISWIKKRKNGVKEALSQLDGYVDPYKKYEDAPPYVVTMRGLRLNEVTYPPGYAIPDKYTPELNAACLQAVVVNYAAQAPGIMYYFIKYHPTKQKDGKNCKDRDTKDKAKEIADLIWTYSDIIRNQYGEEKARWQMAQEQVEQNMDSTWDVVTEIRMGQGYNEVVDPNAPKLGAIKNELLAKVIPTWFKNYQPFLLLPSAPGSKAKWECPKRYCA